MGTWVAMRPTITPTPSNSHSPLQFQSERNSCEVSVTTKKSDDANNSNEFRPSSAPSEHSYVEYLTNPPRPQTQRRSHSPTGPESVQHTSERSLSSNRICVREVHADIINGMY
uniref:Uncharacterized protein n=1 Tax=Mesocestoides corti TaxID=53468 RepID=A0A5K3G292_MESCO